MLSPSCSPSPVHDGRLNDRFRYPRDGEGWAIERLVP
jgi:pyridoxine/pyridoxamine 5'-phosphate oxidase